MASPGAGTESWFLAILESVPWTPLGVQALTGFNSSRPKAGQDSRLHHAGEIARGERIMVELGDEARSAGRLDRNGALEGQEQLEQLPRVTASHRVHFCVAQRV